MSLLLSETELLGPEESFPQPWTSLRLYLKAQGLEMSSTAPRQFRGGFGNLNYLVEIDGQPTVLRRPPEGPRPPGANDMAREHRILSRLWRAYSLVPCGLLLCEDVSVLGAPFQLIEFRPGIVIRERLPTGIKARRGTGASLSRMLVECLVTLHGIDPAAVDLDTLGRPEGFMGRTVEGWIKRGSVFVDLLDRQAFDETIAWLRKKVPPDMRATLIHSDFKLNNLILDPGTLEPRAIIDWDMGTRGDPLWDLAVMLSYWAEPGDPDFMHRMRQMPTIELNFWRRAEVLDAYARLSGRDIADFTFYRALSVFRSAFIFLQLFDRYRRDPEPNARFATFDRLGSEMLEFSFEIAMNRAL